MIPQYASRPFRGKQMLLFRYFVPSLGKTVTSMLLVFFVQQFLSLSHHSRGRFTLFLEHHFPTLALSTTLAALLVGVQILGAYITYDNRISAQKVAEILEVGV